MKLKKFIDRLFKKSKSFEDEFGKELLSISKGLKFRAQLEAHKDPKRRTGELIKSIRAPIKKTRFGFFIQLQAGNSKVNYAKYIEYGTSRIYPRLFLKRSQEIENRKIPNELKEKLKLIVSGLV